MKDGKKRNHSAQPFLEALDTRALPSAGMSALLSRGVLTINGTAEADAIDVSVSQAFNRRGLSQAVVRVEGVGQYAANRVTKIVIRSGEGDDTIRVVETTRRLIPTRIEAGNGNDTIQTGAEADVILAGNGNDTIISGGGLDRIVTGTGQSMVNGVLTSPSTPIAKPPGSPVVLPKPKPTPTPSNPPVVFPMPGFPTPSTTTKPSVPSNKLGVPLTALELAVVNQVNQMRQAAGLAPLRVNSRLAVAAQIQAENMGRLDRMSHTLSDTSTPSPVDRLVAAGYQYQTAGENIAYNYLEANDVVAAWMSSAGHRANILNPDYTETGVAIRVNSFGEQYYAQVFGSPG